MRFYVGHCNYKMQFLDYCLGLLLFLVELLASSDFSRVPALGLLKNSLQLTLFDGKALFITVPTSL